MLSGTQKWLLVASIVLIAIGIFLAGFKGRFVWVPGQNNIHNIDHEPKILDTWTGKYKNWQEGFRS